MVLIAYTGALGTCVHIHVTLGLIQEALESMRTLIIACVMMKKYVYITHMYNINTHK